jgi:Leucine-rich repeat (LRR) protein
MSAVARSLAELLRMKKSVTEVILVGSPDLVCNNLMCEKVTKPCLCRLERALEGSIASRVEILDLSGNRLEGVPPAVTRMPKLRVLDLRNNAFEHMPKELEKLTGVKILMGGNPLK